MHKTVKDLLDEAKSHVFSKNIIERSRTVNDYRKIEKEEEILNIDMLENMNDILNDEAARKREINEFKEDLVVEFPNPITKEVKKIIMPGKPMPLTKKRMDDTIKQFF